jgi:hypothetical protein
MIANELVEWEILSGSNGKGNNLNLFSWRGGW